MGVMFVVSVYTQILINPDEREKEKEKEEGAENVLKSNNVCNEQ